MSLTTFVLAVLLLTMCASTGKSDYCQMMYKKCKFRLGFTKSLPTYELMKKPNVAFTPRIRSKKFGMLIGTVQSNGIAPKFLFEKAGYPVSYFGKPPYSITHFKPIALKDGGSAIAHETFRGDNFLFAKFRCVMVSFSSYTILRTNGSVRKHVNNVKEEDNACVVFKTV